MKKNSDNRMRKRSVIDDLELESALGYPKIALYGDMSATVTGVCRIERYAEEEIVVKLERLSAAFVGKKMSLVYLTENAVRIDGYICGLSLERLGRNGR